MKAIISLSVGLLLAAWAGAEVCNEIYHMQTATQYILQGDSPTTLARMGAAVSLDKTMAGVTFISDSTEYKMITDFDATGTCSAWVPKSVDFALRKKAEKKFSPVKEQFSIKFTDTAFTYKTPGWDEYWFGFASSVDSTAEGLNVHLYDEIGKKKGVIPLYLWYGNAILTRTLKTTNGATKPPLTHFYSELTSHPDSAALAQVLVNTWKQYVKSDTQDVAFKVQLIKITYDSLATPIGILRERKAPLASGFHANQMGQMVLIQLGSKQPDLSESVSLYGMMGNKITTLHPTGYAYQWNGKTSYGADASTGVYFVQAGNRVLGKFFYNR